MCPLALDGTDFPITPVRVLHAGHYLSACRTVRPGLPSISRVIASSLLEPHDADSICRSLQVLSGYTSSQRNIHAVIDDLRAHTTICEKLDEPRITLRFYWGRSSLNRRTM